ncbi:MAG: type II secretion system secretin GspD [Pseudomonadota bacterium]
MKRPNLGLTLAAASWLALAQAQAPSPNQRITPNIQNADISVLADAVGKATGITFTIDPRVRATMTLINPKPMTPQQFYETFLSLLQVYQFAAVRSGNVVKIVPADAVKQMAPGGGSGNGPDEIIDAVIETKNLSAQQLNVVIRQLIPTSGTVLTVTGTNALILNDRASNVQRIQRLVKQLDEAGAGGIETVKLVNSNATDVVRTLSTATSGAPADAGGSPVRIIADDRTNSVLVSGEPGQRQRIINLITELDKPVSDSDNTERRYLKYAKSDDVAALLTKQLAGSTGSSGAAGAPGAPAAAAGPAADRTVNIVSDKATNLLIITAPPKTRRALWATVDAMDIARAQVLIEAFIADITIDKSRDLGVNWAVFSQQDGKIIPGGVFDAPIGSTSPLDIAGLAQIIANPSSATSIPTGATFGVGRLVDNGISWAAMIRALTADTNTNVVAMPTQVTMDNQEVNLESGQQVPFITGQYTNTGTTSTTGSVNPFTTVQRQDVGTKLKITPQLNGSDAMTLTIDLESSELAGSVGDAGSQITNKRTFHNVLLVKNQQWIVVGGLIRDSKAAGESRVPFLSRIPLLGNLFKVKNDKRQKANLMVFIKPTILTNSIDVQNATNDKYRQLQDVMKMQQDKYAPLPSPQLPSLNAPSDVAPVVPGPAAPPAGNAPQTSPVP